METTSGQSGWSPIDRSLLFGEVELMETLMETQAVCFLSSHIASLLFGEVELMETAHPSPRQPLASRRFSSEKWN